MALDFSAARDNMVENQVRTNDVTDLAIQDAMRAIARERFCPPGKSYLAYAEAAVEYAPGWFLMEPRDIAKLLQAIWPQAGERALCIAAPYAAAILDRMGLHVTLLQPEGPPTEVAAGALAGTGVIIRSGALNVLGAEIGEGAQFDVIVCEGATPKTPAAWTAAMAPGGRLGVVERNGPVGKARLYIRGVDGLAARREMFDATSPILPGFATPPAFAF
jgi:protein-L-isoaspartate(D-aspartate) O-methyltransferase